MIIGKRHALLWGPLFIFIVAFTLHVNQMFIMFAALGLLAPVSYALGRRKLADIAVTRHTRSVMTAGESGRVALTLRNDGALRQFFLLVRDRLPEGLESPEEGEVLVADLPAGAEECLHYSLLARRRGVYQVGPSALEGSDYLGLYKFVRHSGDATELLVYPRAVPIPNLWPRNLRGRTPHKSRRRLVGPSPDVYGLRDYTPGDDLRRIAWKASARRGKLAVIETEQSDATQAVILLDLQAGTHAGAGDVSTLEYAATLAASLATEALSRGCNVGLIAEGAGEHTVAVSGDPRQRLWLLEALARVRADGRAELGTVLAAHERGLPPGCAVAVISPATGVAPLALAARLRALGHPVVWCALARHTFPPIAPGEAEGYESLLAHLAAQGARVVAIRGDVPLETNLWRRASRGRSA